MFASITSANQYYADGCGRCSLFSTPACKVITWHQELTLLRQMVLACGLTEELKWKHPCYTFGNSNVVLIHCFKDYCAIAFFKGALLADKQNLLVAPTEHVQAGRQMRFTNYAQIVELETHIKGYVLEAINLEKAGAKIAYKQTAEFEMPQELEQRFNESPLFKAAFYALTPGRQRGYLLFFSAPKQSKTRVARIEKYTEAIHAGKGLNE